MIEGHRTTHHNLLKLFQFAFVAQATYTFTYDFSILLFLYHIMIAALIGRGFSDPRSSRRGPHHHQHSGTVVPKRNNNNPKNHHHHSRTDSTASSMTTTTTTTTGSGGSNPRLRLAKSVMIMLLPLLCHILLYDFPFFMMSARNASRITRVLSYMIPGVDPAVIFGNVAVFCEGMREMLGAVVNFVLSIILMPVSAIFGSSYYFSPSSSSDTSLVFQQFFEGMRRIVGIFVSSPSNNENGVDDQTFMTNLAFNHTQENMILRQRLASSSVLPMTFMIDRCGMLWMIWLDIARGMLAFAMLSVDCNDYAFSVGV